MLRLPAFPPIAPCLVTALAVALAVTPASAAWPTQPIATTPIAPTAFMQREPASVADGAGGAFVAWEDLRSVSSFDVYLQHVLADGRSDPAWPAAGVPVCVVDRNQTDIKIIADGVGGAILAWTDERQISPFPDVYAQRVMANGTIAPGWPANGVAVAATAKAETSPSICSDGAGGVIAVWDLEYSSGDHDIYAARINASGSSVFSVPVYTPLSNSQLPVVASDNAGGCYVAFQDYAGSGLGKVFAAHLGSTGSQIYAPTVFYVANYYDQRAPLICIDGSGGAFIAWYDLRTGDVDVYVSRVGPTQAPQQPFYGNAVQVAGRVGINEYPSGLAYDGAGGAIVTWSDQTIPSQAQATAQRVLTTSSFAPGWPAGGIQLGPVGSYQSFGTPVPDGTGGAVFSWNDSRSGPFAENVYGTRLTAGGARAPRWSPYGDVIAISNRSSYEEATCTDGRRGAIVAYVDYQLDPSHWQIFVQRIDRYAALGDAEPKLTGVKDVHSDQGGQVKLTWNASYLDVDPDFGIGSYWIWRATPAALAVAAVSHGARWLDEMSDEPAIEAEGARVASPSSRLFRRAEESSAQYAWEFVASQPANALGQYSYVAATTRDSIGGSNPRTAFMVEAHAMTGSASWASAPDSGYSVDNLAPAMPAPFSGNYGGGATHLHWGRNTEADLVGYRLYRGVSAGFVPGPSNLIAATPDTGYGDAGAAGSYYKISAVDIHGNESPFASLGPGSTTDAPAEVVRVLWLGAMTPNPARAGSLLRFALPRATRVELAVHDAAGRLVRTLVDATFEPGTHEVRWDGLDGGGRRLQSGLYFTSLRADGETRRGRFVVVK